MPEDLQEVFKQAQIDIQAIARALSAATLLQLEALQAQAEKGDITGNRPGFTDFSERMQYDAWARLKGKSPDEAIQEYNALTASVKALLSRPANPSPEGEKDQ